MNNNNGLTNEEFNKFYDTNQKNQIDMNIKLYEKYYILKKIQDNNALTIN